MKRFSKDIASFEIEMDKTPRQKTFQSSKVEPSLKTKESKIIFLVETISWKHKFLGEKRTYSLGCFDLHFEQIFGRNSTRCVITGKEEREVDFSTRSRREDFREDGEDQLTTPKARAITTEKTERRETTEGCISQTRHFLSSAFESGTQIRLRNSPIETGMITGEAGAAPDRTNDLFQRLSSDKPESRTENFCSEVDEMTSSGERQSRAAPPTFFCKMEEARIHCHERLPGSHLNFMKPEPRKRCVFSGKYRSDNGLNLKKNLLDRAEPVPQRSDDLSREAPFCGSQGPTRGRYVSPGKYQDVRSTNIGAT